jgi:hypothetical protein
MHSTAAFRLGDSIHNLLLFAREVAFLYQTFYTSFLTVVTINNTLGYANQLMFFY